MMRLILAGYLLVGASLGANAQESVPNFTGRWSGKLEVIVIDRTTGKVGQVQEVTITYDLTKQDGRLFWGTVVSDKTKTRPIVLAFSFNYGTLIGGSDAEGFHRLTVISENRMESCVTDNGAGLLLASCGLIQRAQ